MQQRRNRQFGRRNNNNRGNNNHNRGNNQNRNGNGSRFNVKQAENKRDNYLNLHKEHFGNDRVKAEFYLQHAEHWQRLLNEHAPELMEPQREGNEDGDDFYEDDLQTTQGNARETSTEMMDAAEEVIGDDRADFLPEDSVQPQPRRENREQREPREHREPREARGEPRRGRPARERKPHPTSNSENEGSGADILSALPGAIAIEN